MAFTQTTYSREASNASKISAHARLPQLASTFVLVLLFLEVQTKVKEDKKQNLLCLAPVSLPFLFLVAFSSASSPVR